MGSGREELGGGWGGPRRKGGRRASHPHTTPVSLLWGCVRARKREPPLTLAPGRRGAGPAEPPHWSCPPAPSSLHFVACFRGLVSAQGRGAIALYILEKLPGTEGGPESPLTPALGPSSWLSVFLSKCASEGPPTSNPAPGLRIPGSLPSPEARPAPPHLGGAAHA